MKSIAVKKISGNTYKTDDGRVVKLNQSVTYIGTENYGVIFQKNEANVKSKENQSGQNRN